LQTLLKKFPVCCLAAGLSIYIYIYIYCTSTVWFCVEFRPTETEKDRGRRLGWSVNNKFCISWERRKKIKENETAWRKNPTHFPASEESKISDLKIPMFFAIENWQVLLAKCPSFSRSFFSESVVSTCFWWL
jgi:hypothetical protein